MDIDAKDCRLEGFRAGQTTTWFSRTTCWLRATHLPTGVMVEIRETGSGGPADKRRLMVALQQAVNDHMDRELARL